jgi:hypothetical protein
MERKTRQLAYCPPPYFMVHIPAFDHVAVPLGMNVMHVARMPLSTMPSRSGKNSCIAAAAVCKICLGPRAQGAQGVNFLG